MFNMMSIWRRGSDNQSVVFTLQNNKSDVEDFHKFERTCMVMPGSIL